jgi:hypothetical protein
MDQELQSVTVWFTPQQETLEPGSCILLDPTISAGFEIMATASSRFESSKIIKKFNPATWKNTHCRAQIFSQKGTTDIRTADALAKFYRCIELRDWDSLSKCLMPNLTTVIANGVFDHGVDMTTGIDEYINNVKVWSNHYPDTTWFDVVQAFISTDKALVEFRIWCEGVAVIAGLSQYQFEVVDNTPTISTIFNHSSITHGSLHLTKDGMIDWGGVRTSA